MLLKGTDNEKKDRLRPFIFENNIHFQKPLPALFYRNWNLDGSFTS